MGTLLQAPQAFEVNDLNGSKVQARIFSASDARLYQQRTLSVVLKSIVSNAQSQQFCAYGCGDPVELVGQNFRGAIARINGIKDENGYCQNVRRMDDFMNASVGEKSKDDIAIHEGCRESRQFLAGDVQLVDKSLLCDLLKGL